MKKKRNQCYLLLGTVIMLILACVCSFVFTKDNIKQAEYKHEFESIYTDTSIDFIIPGPSYSQIEEIERSGNNGIACVTPYYETTTAVTINGDSVNGTTLLFPFALKMNCTPYGPARIISGEKQPKDGEAIIDKAYAQKHGAKIGDHVSIRIGEEDYKFTVKAVSETNTYYKDGTIALILSAADEQLLQAAGIRYSAAYVSASDISACETYLYSDYKPLSRLKDKDAFDNEEIYEQHLRNFNAADWSKEITNCQKNYAQISVKYDNVATSIWRNWVIMAVIVILTIVIFNSLLLSNRGIKVFMRNLLVKKSETKQSIKSFYSSGIIANCVIFCVVDIALFVVICVSSQNSVTTKQILNCIIPCSAAIIASMLMVLVSNGYIKRHYIVKTVKQKDSTEKIEVEVI
jgi:hypothetical protein